MTKNYFTPLEAAEYACVPLLDFEAQADSCGIPSFQYMGQTVFRREGLQASMERAWKLSNGVDPMPPTAVRGPGKAFLISAGLLPEVVLKPQAAVALIALRERTGRPYSVIIEGLLLAENARDIASGVHQATATAPATSAEDHEKPPIQRSSAHEHHLSELERIRRENEDAK